MAKKKSGENYLDRIPVRKVGLEWDKAEDGIVTLLVENKGFFNRAAQLLLRKPKVSHIHLDEIGSYVWCEIDGKRTLAEIAEPFGEHFGEKIEPKYERLCEFVRILAEYGFVTFIKDEKDN